MVARPEWAREACSDAPPRLRDILREPHLWLSVALGVIYFHRELFLRESVFLRDLSSYFLPQKDVLVALLTRGEIPLWNPLIQGGQAYLPSLASSALFPTNLLYLVLPAIRALNWTIGVHMVIGLASTYWLARLLRCGRWSSLLAAAVFSFSGPVLSLVNLLNHYLALSLLPLMCCFWHLFLNRGRPRHLAAAAAVGTAQVFAGSPEVNTMTLLFLLGWALWVNNPGHRRGVVGWIVLSLLILGCAAVQLAPTAEIVWNSPRGFGFGPGHLTSWSLPLKRAPEIVVPAFLGHVDVLDRGAFWGGLLVDNDFPYLISVYFGCCAVILAGMGLGAGTRPLHRRPRTFLLLWSVVFVVAAFGRNIPLAGGWLHHLPFAQAFRYPSKMLAAAALPLALLTAHSVDAWFAQPRNERRRLPGWGAITAPVLVAVLAALGCLFLAIGSRPAAAVVHWLFAEGAGAAAISGLSRSLLHTTAAASVIALLCLSRRHGARPWQLWLVVSVTVLDVATGNLRINPSAPDKLITRAPPAVQMIRNTIDGGRLYRTGHTPGYLISAPSNHSVWKADWVREVLVGWTPATYGIPATLSRDLLQLTPLPLMKLKHIMEAQPWRLRPQLLGAAGVSLVLTDEEAASQRLHHLGEVPNRTDRRFSLFRNTMTAPPARFVTRWQVASTEEQATAAMLHPAYDPRATAVILGGEKPQTAPPRHSPAAHSIRVRRSTSSRTSYSVSTQRDGYLVLTDPFGPGWRTTVNGRPAAVQRADLAFVGIFLPAGEHVVERSYLPTSLVVGGLCSLICLSILAALGCGILEARRGV